METPIEKHMRKLLQYLTSGTRGGYVRVQIINILMEKPCNTNYIARKLNLDYKTVQHHLRVLSKNNIVTGTGTAVAKNIHEYRISTFVQSMNVFRDIFVNTTASTTETRILDSSRRYTWQ